MGTHVARAPTPVVLSAGAGRRVPWGLLTAVVGVGLWLIVDPRTPDLAGQVYRANLFREAGFVVWDGRWYGGHNMPGYSLLFPPLGALLGVRAVGAAAVLASAALFERVAVAAYGARARWAAAWFAVAALGDVWSGRVTFALGVSVALGAVLALTRGRALAAVILAGLCAACSPVAGVLLALAGLTHSLVVRSPRSLIVLGGPPVVVVAALAALFPEGGWEPYPLLSFLASAAVIAGFLWVLPAQRRLAWIGGVVYLAACVACVAVHTPMGANVERYGVLLAGPLLLCELLAPDRDGGAPADPGLPEVGGGEVAGGAVAEGELAPGQWLLSPGLRGFLSAARGRFSAPAPGGCPSVVAVAALLGIGVWTVWGPVRETAAVAGNASTGAAYYVPVERFVATHGGPLVRVEVPFTRGHWEAAWLAQRVSLARGWEKQLDERYDGVLLSKALTAGQYRAWLEENAVRYVALPDAPLDPSSAGEGRLIEAGLRYLREVWRTRHWRIYEVLDPTPLVQGPGTLSGLGHDWFSLRARTEGSFVVRVRYTRYWTVTAGAACVGKARGGWTEVSASRAGVVSVAARFSLGRALGLGGSSCRV
jgi:hypothetical protein